MKVYVVHNEPDMSYYGDGRVHGVFLEEAEARTEAEQERAEVDEFEVTGVMPRDLAEAIWAKLTEYNPACSCCSGDDEYIDRVNEIGALIDGRRWVRLPYKPDTPTTYETVMPEAAHA